MVSLTLRAVKGSRLTNAEVDANFTALRDAIKSTPETFTVVTASSVTMTVGQHVVLTNASASTATLPASPSAGDVVFVTPANDRTDNVIARNGKKIMGLSSDLTINLKYQTVRLRYVDSTLGWRLM